LFAAFAHGPECFAVRIESAEEYGFEPTTIVGVIDRPIHQEIQRPGLRKTANTNITRKVSRLSIDVCGCMVTFRDGNGLPEGWREVGHQ
tara:strand:+ start:345 stop:611 length:267 start_codon:yes stop_codon:yes gene_type:complete